MKGKRNGSVSHHCVVTFPFNKFRDERLSNMGHVTLGIEHMYLLHNAK